MKNEPVISGAVLSQIAKLAVTAAASFGLELTLDQALALLAIVEAVIAWRLRGKVSPVDAPAQQAPSAPGA